MLLWSFGQLRSSLNLIDSGHLLTVGFGHGSNSRCGACTEWHPRTAFAIYCTWAYSETAPQWYMCCRTRAPTPIVPTRAFIISPPPMVSVIDWRQRVFAMVTRLEVGGAGGRNLGPPGVFWDCL